MVAQAARTGGLAQRGRLDLDHFKQINDRHGHDKGDEVLAAAAEALTGTLRVSDFVARRAARSSSSLLPDTGLDGALIVAENLRAALAGHGHPRPRPRGHRELRRRRPARGRRRRRRRCCAAPTARCTSPSATGATGSRRAARERPRSEPVGRRPARGVGSGAGWSSAAPRSAPDGPSGCPCMTGCRRRRAPRADGVLMRLMHVGDEPVVVRAAQTARDRVVIGAEAATRGGLRGGDRRACASALGVDDDLSAVPRALPRRPAHRAGRALAAVAARRRGGPSRSRRSPGRSPSSSSTSRARRRSSGGSSSGSGRRCERTGLRDLPSRRASSPRRRPALLQSLDLSAGRSLALVRCAREVAAGRVDLRAPDHEAGWRRLRAIPRHRLVDDRDPRPTSARAATTRSRPATSTTSSSSRGCGRGNPHARATEDEVREFFAPYAPWGGLAGVYALRAGLRALRRPADPRRAGTRSSARVAGPLAA